MAPSGTAFLSAARRIGERRAATKQFLCSSRWTRMWQQASAISHVTFSHCAPRSVERPISAASSKSPANPPLRLVAWAAQFSRAQQLEHWHGSASCKTKGRTLRSSLGFLRDQAELVDVAPEEFTSECASVDVHSELSRRTLCLHLRGCRGLTRIVSSPPVAERHPVMASRLLCRACLVQGTRLRAAHHVATTLAEPGYLVLPRSVTRYTERTLTQSLEGRRLVYSTGL